MFRLFFVSLTAVLVLNGCERSAEMGETTPSPPAIPAAASPLEAVHTPAAPESMPSAMPQPVSPSAEEPAPAPLVQKIYRPSDTRPRRDDARAEEFGIRKYASQRLILYTDLDPEIAEPLPALIDRVYETWVDYFGELPPDREGTPYQMTGYLIDQPQRFVEAGMLPEGPPMFRFGRHLGAEFWMNKMNSDYYRRHLLIHEATHCFMTATLQQYPPRWYLEGMAEYFGTHRLHPDGTVTFGVMPEQSDEFPGLGRIELIQQQLVQQQFASLSRLGTYSPADWDQPLPVPYAWSWAICLFLDQHPRYQDRFRQLGQHMEGNDFLRFLDEHFAPEKDLLEAEWSEFSRRLVYGMDVAANAFQTHSGPLQSLETPVRVSVEAAKGWQSTGLLIPAGITVSIHASGEVILDQQPRPWVSEPQGISIRYAAGEPIGRLLAAVLSPSDPEMPSTFPITPIGQSGTLSSQRPGELWLRINDLGNGLTNNSGTYEVEIRRSEPPAIVE